MTQIIVFKQDNGRVAVIYPTPEAVAVHGIEAIAVKDVPAGKPFKIIDAADIPPRDQRDGWTIDDALLTDGIGGESNEFEVTP
jgi:hypothetical protein